MKKILLIEDEEPIRRVLVRVLVEKIKSLANKMREKLGDRLYEIKGSENRPVGRLN